MNILTALREPVILDIAFIDDSIRFELADGRSISAPLEWFPRLRDASEEARTKWELIGRGCAAHWPEVDEDISALALMGLPD